MNDVPKTLAELKKLPIEQQGFLLLVRLGAIYPQVKSGGGFHKGNLLLGDDPYGLAASYEPKDKRKVCEYFFGAPWTWLVNQGYLVDPRGTGFYDLSDEGMEALNSATAAKSSETLVATSSALPHNVNQGELLSWVIANPNKPFDPSAVVSAKHTTDWEWQAVLAQMEDLRRLEYIDRLKQDAGGSTYWTITTKGQNYLRALERAEEAAAEPTPADTVHPSPAGSPEVPSPKPAEDTAPTVNSIPPDVSNITPAPADGPPNDASLSIDLATISDTPTTDDELGFQPYVMAIAKFLSSGNTKGPLTLSIEGEWGSGKSSFMKQLKKLLAAPPTDLLTEGQRPPVSRTFWFDAWRQDKQEALWAAFALAFCRGLRDKASHKWRAGVRLACERALTNPDLSGFALALVKVMAWVIGFIFCFTLLSKLGPNWFLQSLLIVTVVAAALMQSFKAIKEVFGSPFETHISEYLRGPDYAQRVAFVEQFHGDFTRMIDSYARNVEKIYVFIDDVDRCEVPKAAELMQAINLLIGDDRRLIFILGMDREKVAAGIAAKYKDLAPYLKNTEVANEIDFGFSFLEKFIQLPFQIPSPGVRSLSTFIEKISPAPRAAIHQTPPLTPIASEFSSTPVAPASTRQQKIERDLEFTGDSEGVREAASMFAVTVSRSPRKVKQFINVFRLRAHIANQLALFDNNDKGAPKLTFEQLAKFVAVSLIWPKPGRRPRPVPLITRVAGKDCNRLRSSGEWKYETRRH